ncbi:MAG: hypothetical protein N2595_09075 [bacterium]|nr:hypothetical protein [bacterium]
MNGSVRLRSCEVAGNTAGVGGGGAYWENASAAMALENCTVASNWAPSAAGVWAAGGGALVNTIVYHNNSGDFSNTAAGATVRYSCVPALVSGEGNITNEPLLKDLVARDLRLQDASPCIDAGSNVAWAASAPDVAGRPRKLGPQVDMGAHEATRGALIQLTPRTSLTLSAVVGSFTTGTVRVDNVGRAVLTGEVLGVSWPFAVAAGSPYVVEKEASTTVVVRFEAWEEGLTNILVTFTGGGNATLRLWGYGYIPEPGWLGVIGMLLFRSSKRRQEAEDTGARH